MFPLSKMQEKRFSRTIEPGNVTLHRQAMTGCVHECISSLGRTAGTALIAVRSLSALGVGNDTQQVAEMLVGLLNALPCPCDSWACHLVHRGEAYLKRNGDSRNP